MPLSGAVDAELIREVRLNATDVMRHARDLQDSAQRARAESERIRVQFQRMALARSVQRDQRANDHLA
jgi:hypothetical protein